MHKRFGYVVLALVLIAPEMAQAHAYSTGKEPYAAFLEGAGSFFTELSLIVPVLALAVALLLWRPSGLVHTWHFFLFGSLVGIFIAPFADSWAEVVPMVTGVILAVHAALLPLERIKHALPWLAALSGFGVAVAAFYGHGFVEVPVTTRFGLLFAANTTLALAAGLVHSTRVRVQYPAVLVMWRIAASWIAATLVLYMSFVLTQ